MSGYDRLAAAFHARIDGIAGAVDAMAPGIEQGAQLLVQAALGDHKVLISGAAQDVALADHAANILREAIEGMPPLPALSLTATEAPAALRKLDRDLRALSRDGDVLLCVDTSSDGHLAKYCRELAGERNLSPITLSVSGESEHAARISINNDDPVLRTELALMAIHCLHQEIRHLLLGE